MITNGHYPGNTSSYLYLEEIITQIKTNEKSILSLTQLSEHKFISCYQIIINPFSKKFLSRVCLL